MRTITKLILSLFAPWGGFVTANIWSLPGAGKSDGTARWLKWYQGEPLFEFVAQIQEHRANDWSNAYLSLLSLSTADIIGDPDEMGRYYNNVAAAAYNAQDYTAAQTYIGMAAAAGATETEVVKAIIANQGVMS